MEIYTVKLTCEERDELEKMTNKVKCDNRTGLRARALLLCDAGNENEKWTTYDIHKALGLSERTIERLKKSFVDSGLSAALGRKDRDASTRAIKFDGAFEARLVAVACSQAPEGRSRWTVRLLADKAVELGITDTVSIATVQRILKKTNLNHTSRNTGKSPRKGTLRS
jgi:hypothetical protein